MSKLNKEEIDQLNDLYDLYEINETFKTYVNKYKKTHELLLSEALCHKIVINYAHEIFNKDADEKTWRTLLWQEQTKNK